MGERRIVYIRLNGGLLSLLERPLSLFISKDVFEILGRRGSKSSKSEITRIFRIQLIQQGSSGKFRTRHEGRIKDTVTIKRTERA